MAIEWKHQGRVSHGYIGESYVGSIRLDGLKWSLSCPNHPYMEGSSLQALKDQAEAWAADGAHVYSYSWLEPDRLTALQDKAYQHGYRYWISCGSVSGSTIHIVMTQQQWKDWLGW